MVGGTVSGLTLGSLVLANGADTVTIPAGAGVFDFPTFVASGNTYAVTVKTQPSGQTCQLTAGATGTLMGTVNNVTVVCAYGVWTWVGGSNLPNASGVYGARGVAAATNVPGARYAPVSWNDSRGNLWLFGGQGVDSAGASGLLNDLWEFANVGSGQWSWDSGSQVQGSLGSYGPQGMPLASNEPPARVFANSWFDAIGNLWMFGGSGLDSTGATFDTLNDLWKYDLSSGQWIWVGGSNTQGSPGVYGTQGMTAPGNVPGARAGAASWRDLWVFGGQGVDSTGMFGNLNDLWKYDLGNGWWVWVSGSNAQGSPGVYGTQGVAAPANAPGARTESSSWTDVSGNLWLFGGQGVNPATGAVTALNDLWEYTVGNRQWTWVGGSNTPGSRGVYGAQGTSAASNIPGARYSSTSWTDGAGNLWLFGGQGLDSTGTAGFLNDLWKYSPSTRQWTWISGSNLSGALGSYGTQATASVSNVPGARHFANAWTDSSGNLCLFGGSGITGTGAVGSLNDLWCFNPAL
jgi:N-acetylneuraminic acid mutarotase